jgi:CRP-like cAMP-binding protein
MNPATAPLLRLVRSAPERDALDSGQIDAVLDAKTGTAFLLPAARRHLFLAGGPITNRLLAALSREDYRSLMPELEPVALTSGEVLYEPGDRIRYVYFLNDGQVSLLMVMADRKALEVGLVGREGMIGIPLALGTDVSPARAQVHGSGSALRMKAASFGQALGRCLPFQLEVLRYAYVKLMQARQSAACNRFHQVEARLAGWLLLTGDRLGSDHFHFTHEVVAETLGVRRVGVTNAASSLQRRKMITYHRGSIRILDRQGLMAAACECYEVLGKLAR